MKFPDWVLPPGMDRDEFGARLWGVGFADAQKRQGNMMRQELVQLMLDCSKLAALFTFYTWSGAVGRGADTAGERAKLIAICLRRCLEIQVS
jgi:hypothetical protein